MDDVIENDPRFPIGRFDRSAYSDRAANISTIAALPAAITGAVTGFSDQQLDTPYRDGGWTIRQTVHHLADSHINSLCRFKLALTEADPIIRPYHEDLWANLADSRMPIGPSLVTIEGVHARWTELLANMSDEDFRRELIHPESGTWTLESMLAMYAWHSLHHTAHITSTAARLGWVL
jgi:uncharacterized damage-inducible protein DinB